MENKDGSFSVYSVAAGEGGTGDQAFINLPGKKIKAHELKTFLKVNSFEHAVIFALLRNII